MYNERMSTPFNHSIIDNSSSINTNLNPNLSQVSFRVKFETNFGQAVYIIGNIEELGSWEPSKAVALSTNKDKYPWWKSTGDLVCPVGMEIYYKYLVKEGNNYHWEVVSRSSSQNRHIVITSPGKFIIYDEKGSLYSQIKSINNNINPSLMITPNNTLYNNNLNTNTYTTTNIYNPSSNTISSIKQEGISMDLLSISKMSVVDDDVVGKENIQELISYENNIFDNHYLVQDKNLYFDFLNNGDNLKSEDRIIIASSYLPFIVEKNEDSFKIKIIDDKIVSLVLYDLKERNLCDVIWVGMLRNIDDFTESEVYQLMDFLQEQLIYLVYVNKKSSDNFWIYIKEIISPIFSKSQVEIENPYFLEHEKYFEDYLKVNEEFGKIIHNITIKNDLIMVNDIDLAMVPRFLMKKNLDTKIGFYFHCPIPSSEVLNVLPGHMEILKSLLLCDVIGFHVFKYAKNFLNSINREFGINFEVEKKGNIIFNYLGRDILIHILNAGLDIDYLNGIKNSKNVSLIRESYLPLIRDKFIITSIDNLQSPKQIYIKLEAYKIFLEKHPDQIGKIVLIQILINNNNNHNCSMIDAKIKEITDLYGGESIYIKYLNTLSVFEQVALFSLTNILLFLQIEMYNGLFALEREFISLQNENKIFGLVINENIGLSSILKSYIKVNSFNQNEITKVIDNIMNCSLDDKKKNFNHDMEYITKNSTFNWIRTFLINLKRMTLNETSSIKIAMGIGMDLRIMKLNASFTHLELAQLSNAYNKTKERIFFFDYNTLKGLSDEENTKIVKEKTDNFLKDLLKNKNNHIYIISRLKKEELNDIEKNISGIGLGAESGYYYKGRNNNNYETLMEIKDWSWKEKVIKLFSSFIEKTEGSIIIEKDSSIIWNYKNCDAYFGHLQANELLTHLNNIFEGKKLDIINGNDYVEVKPKNLNKGFFISQILKKEFLQERNIDMIFTLGDDIDCEDMFKYLNCIEIQFDKIGKRMELFGVTIGKKPSNAKFFLNEVNELFFYFDSFEH